MKILLISAYFPPDTGSAAHLFYELGIGLVKMDHDVTVLTSFPGYHTHGDISKYKRKKWMTEKMDGISVARAWVPQFPRHIPAGRALWQFSCAISFALSTFKLPVFDVVIVYSPPLPLGYTGWFLKKRKRVPYILNVQDLFPQSAIDLGILKNKVLIKLFESMERWIYRHADLITVHSPGNRNHVVMKGAPPHSVEVMPNWVDTDFITPGERMNGFRKEFDLGDKFIVSFAGVIGYSQDIDVIIGAADILREKNDIFFLIVGDGVEKERLENKASSMGLSNVMFFPMQPRDKYPSVLHASDVCLATLHKGVRTPVVPSKILSIMAAGKPVIACMHLGGDAPKLVEKAGCGYILPPEDPRILADHILKLYNNKGLKEEMGGKGRMYAEKELSLSIAAERYLNLIEGLRD